MPLAAILGLCVALSSAASGGQPQRIDFAQEPQTPPDSPQNAAPAPPLTNAQTDLHEMSGHQLNTSQQNVIRQIHKYIKQATDADAAGDLQRARNPALKAQLLSDDLVRQ